MGQCHTYPDFSRHLRAHSVPSMHAQHKIIESSDLLAAIMKERSGQRLVG